MIVVKVKLPKHPLDTQAIRAYNQGVPKRRNQMIPNPKTTKRTEDSAERRILLEQREVIVAIFRDHLFSNEQEARELTKELAEIEAGLAREGE